MAMYRCKKCAKQYSEYERFCEDCGSEIVSVNTCDECGAELPEGAAVCNNCGAPVEAAAVPEADRFCGECGTAIPDGAIVCGNCGAPVGGAATKVCEECGAALSQGAAVCGNCGAPVEMAVSAATAAPVVAVSAAVPSAAPKRKTAITIGNIFFLLTLIPATILLLGDVFVFRASGVLNESFGYFGFSKTFNYLTDLVGILEGLGVDSLEHVSTLTGVFGFTWTIVVAALIFVAIEYIKGIIAANKGTLLYNICFMPLVYLAMSFLFNVIVYTALIYPINDVLESGVVGALNEFVGFELSLTMGTAAVWLACIALVNAVIYVILKLAEKLSRVQ